MLTSFTHFRGIRTSVASLKKEVMTTVIMTDNKQGSYTERGPLYDEQPHTLPWDTGWLLKVLGASECESTVNVSRDGKYSKLVIDSTFIRRPC